MDQKTASEIFAIISQKQINRAELQPIETQVETLKKRLFGGLPVLGNTIVGESMDGSGSVSIPTSVTWVDRRQDPKLRFSLSNEGVITISGIKFSMFAKFDFPGVAPGQTEQFELPFSEVHVYAVLPIIFESFVGELVGQRIDSVVEALAVDGQWVFPFPRKTALDNIERLLSLFP